MSSRAQPTLRRDALVVSAVVLGMIVGVVATLPLALHLRGWLGLPDPNPMPLEYRADQSFSLTYWVPWALTWLVVVIPGLVVAWRPATRRVGLGYAIAAGLSGGGVAVFYVLFEFGGFTAD